MYSSKIKQMLCLKSGEPNLGRRVPVWISASHSFPFSIISIWQLELDDEVDKTLKQETLDDEEPRNPAWFRQWRRAKRLKSWSTGEEKQLNWNPEAETPKHHRTTAEKELCSETPSMKNYG